MDTKIKVVVVLLIILLAIGGIYAWYAAPKKTEPAAYRPQTLSFSRMKRDTIYLIRPGDLIKIKDETPNTTRSLSFTPAIAQTHEMEYFPEKKKWLYALPADIKSGSYLITVVTKDKTSGKIVKTKEVEIIIDKNSGEQKDIVDPED